jgi:hypothetical protein
MKLDPDFEALMAKPRPYLSAHAPEFALMRDRTVLEFYASFEEAARAGEARFGRQGEFTVQEVSIVLAQLEAAADRTAAGMAAPQKPDPDYNALVAQPPDFLRSHADQFALMRNQQIIDFYRTFREAALVGRERFGRGDFTVQQVQSEPYQLGSIAMLMTS